MSVEVTQEGSVRQVLQAGGIIGGLVEWAGNVVREGDIAVETLVKGLEAQQLGGAPVGGGAATAGPKESGGVVSPGEDCPLADVVGGGGTGPMKEATSQFKVRVGDIATGVGPGGKAALDIHGKGHAPDNRVGRAHAAAAGGAPRACGSSAGDSRRSGEPHPTSTRCCSIMATMEGGGQRDQFIKAGGAVGELVEQRAEVIQDQMNGRGEGHPGGRRGRAGGAGQSGLEQGEEALGTRQSMREGPELTKEGVPFLLRGTTTGWREFGVQQIVKAGGAAGSEAEGHVHSVEEPSENLFLGGPSSITSKKLLNRDGLLARWVVQGIKGAEDRVNDVEQGPAHPRKLGGAPLGSTDEVVNINVHIGQAAAAGPGQMRVSGRGEGHSNGRVRGSEGGQGAGGVGQGIQGMGRGGVVLQQTVVGNISDGLGGGGEGRRRVLPPHGEAHRDSHKGRLPGTRGKEHAKFGGIRGGKEKAVEAISKVGLGEINPAIATVCKDNVTNEAIKGTAELHGFHRGVGLGGVIDTKESVVHNGTRTAIALGDNTDGTEAEAGSGANKVKGEDNPEGLVNHVRHVLAKEGGVLGGGAVGSPGKGVEGLRGGPRGVSKGDRDTMGAVVAKEPGGGVGGDSTEATPLRAGLLGAKEGKKAMGTNKGRIRVDVLT